MWPGAAGTENGLVQNSHFVAIRRGHHLYFQKLLIFCSSD
jgi:hypothetical protein